eukprot:TRINITY_DN8395_c0_g1_i10.p1 TRINITY_DN8395_c0_g1~~TRINITY_DN8395_c0_g1_i10.p1  ORF type:complete len:303 (-),score=54.20 TRINITY_DN8395_c0_g1_i10:601-1509(-)
MDLKNKVIVIGGGSQGCGLGIATHAAHKGPRSIVLLARTESKLQTATTLVSNAAKDAGHTTIVSHYAVDLSDYDALVKIASTITAAHGVPDIVVSSSCHGLFQSIEEMDPSEASQSMNATFLAAFHLTRVFAPTMIQRNTGYFVFVGSPARFARFFATTYVASRRALHGFVEALRSDLYDTQIKIMYVEPLRLTDSGYFENNPGSLDRLPFFYRLELPLLSQSIHDVGRGVVSGIERGRSSYIPWIGRIVEHLYPILGPLVDWITRSSMLPYSQGGPLSGNRRSIYAANHAPGWSSTRSKTD